MSTDSGKLGKRAEKKARNSALNSKSSMANYYLYFIVVAVICIAGAVQFFLLLGQFLKHQAVDQLDISDQAAVDVVTKSGQPHVVYCQSDLTADHAIPKIVTDIQKQLVKVDGAEDTKFYAMNCFKKQQSGKSVAEEYSFGKNEGFLAIFANQETPKQLNWLSTADHVTKQIAPMVKPTLSKIIYLRDFEVCRDRKHCVIVNSEDREELSRMEMLMKPYVKQFRGIKFTSVDTSFYNIQLDQDFLKQSDTEDLDKEDVKEAMCIVKVVDPVKEQGVNGTSNYQPEVPGKWIAKYMSSVEGEGPVQFLNECESKNAKQDEDGWFALTMTPDVKAKPSEPKVINTPSRREEGKWDKERIGRREEGETKEEDDDMADLDEEEEEPESQFEKDGASEEGDSAKGEGEKEKEDL